MLSHDIRNSLLVDELQLGERLNNDVHNNNHADFALMLAMISGDVTDHPLNFEKKIPLKEVNLREKFSLLPEQAKYAKEDDFARADHLTDAFASDGLRQVFLADCLRKAPLTPFERVYSPEVFSELTPLKQEKLRRELKGLSLEYEPLTETGDGFGILDEINQKAITPISVEV